MAKEPEKQNDALEGEEIAEEVEPSKKSKKEKPPKQKKEGEIPLVLMIGGALGGVVLIIFSVIIGTVVANKLFPPAGNVAHEETTEEVKTEEPTKSQLPAFPDEDSGFEGSQLFSTDAEWNTFNSGKVTTNAKNSTSDYVVIALGIDYSLYYKDELLRRGFAVKGAAAEGEGGGEAEGEGAATVEHLTVDTSSALYKKFQSTVIGKINDFVGSYTTGEHQAMRPQLAEKIREELKPTFKDFGLLIGKVNVLQFMIAKN